MRGVLHISAARSPWRRGGLQFLGATLAVALKSLTGERLFHLIADPLISIAVGQEDGSFKPMPDLIGLGIHELQMLIDAAPEVDVSSQVGTIVTADAVQHAQEIGEIAVRLKAAGFATLDQAFTKADDMERATALAVQAGFATVEEALVGLTALVDANKANGLHIIALNSELEAMKSSAGAAGGDLAAAIAEGDQAQSDLATARARIAELEAAAAKHPSKSKSTDPKSVVAQQG